MGARTPRPWVRRRSVRLTVAAGIGLLAVLTLTAAREGRGRTPTAPGRPAPRGIVPPVTSSAARIPATGSVAGASTRRQAYYEVESSAVAFGEMRPGVPRALPGAIRIRVFSPGDWVLRLVPGSELRRVDQGHGMAPLSRLSWRSAGKGLFRPFSSGRDALIARGKATGGGGEMVTIDLRMQLGAGDDIGHYSTDFRVLLESR